MGAIDQSILEFGRSLENVLNGRNWNKAITAAFYLTNWIGPDAARQTAFENSVNQFTQGELYRIAFGKFGDVHPVTSKTSSLEAELSPLLSAYVEEQIINPDIIIEERHKRLRHFLVTSARLGFPTTGNNARLMDKLTTFWRNEQDGKTVPII